MSVWGKPGLHADGWVKMVCKVGKHRETVPPYLANMTDRLARMNWAEDPPTAGLYERAGHGLNIQRWPRGSKTWIPVMVEF